MMLNKVVVSIVFLSLFSCAGLRDYKSYQPNLQEQAEYYRVQEDIIEKDLPRCEGCLHGAAHEATFAENTNIYELTEVDHLNLKQTKFDIPVVWNKKVEMWVKFFTGRGRQHFINYAQRSGRYAPILSKIMADNQLPRDLIFLAMAESGFQNHARSWATAVGPWQFMPYTGKRYGLHIDWYIDERRDPFKASIAAANYLKDLYRLFDSWELAAAGYNAGEGKISRAIKMYKTKDFWALTNGRYLKPETKNYVPKIMALAIIGKNLQSFGFDNLEFEQALDYEEIMVDGNSDLYDIAEVLEIDFEDIKKYNPELIRWQTPMNHEKYTLRIPIGTKQAWDEFEHKNTVIVKNYKKYQTIGKTNLAEVASKFKVPAKLLAELNPDLVNNSLSPKTSVILPFREDHSVKSSLYADLYLRPRRTVSRHRDYQRTISSQMSKGKFIQNPTVFYKVKKGDSLWSVAQKTGVPMSTIIRTNAHITNKRMILPGDRLAIR